MENIKDKYEVSFKKNRDTVGIFIRCEKCNQMQCIIAKQDDWNKFVISDYNPTLIPKLFNYCSESQRNMLSGFVCPFCAK